MIWCLPMAFRNPDLGIENTIFLLVLMIDDKHGDYYVLSSQLGLFLRNDIQNIQCSCELFWYSYGIFVLTYRNYIPTLSSP